MKLKNKKTGEIGYPYFQHCRDMVCTIVDENAIKIADYSSLAELNEEWEDYEEPKATDYWYIDDLGRAQFSCEILDETEGHPNNGMIRKLYGNYFKNEEEAREVVEKLKAWKRLKDKGFVFCGTDCINTENVIYFEFGERPLTQSEADEAERELEICFGGEE